MEELEPQTEPAEPQAANSPTTGLTRRDFLILAGLAAGGTAIILGRLGAGDLAGPYVSGPLPSIATEFRRFVLARRSPSPEDSSSLMVAAYGGQFPDLRCAVLWVDDPIFQFYNEVADILHLYTYDGQTEFVWLD
jgi:hypothetical protein